MFGAIRIKFGNSQSDMFCNVQMVKNNWHIYPTYQTYQILRETIMHHYLRFGVEETKRDDTCKWIDVPGNGHLLHREGDLQWRTCSRCMLCCHNYKSKIGIITDILMCHNNFWLVVCWQGIVLPVPRERGFLQILPKVWTDNELQRPNCNCLETSNTKLLA